MPNRQFIEELDASVNSDEKLEFGKLLSQHNVSWKDFLNKGLHSKKLDLKIVQKDGKSIIQYNNRFGH